MLRGLLISLMMDSIELNLSPCWRQREYGLGSSAFRHPERVDGFCHFLSQLELYGCFYWAQE